MTLGEKLRQELTLTDEQWQTIFDFVYNELRIVGEAEIWVRQCNPDFTVKNGVASNVRRIEISKNIQSIVFSRLKDEGISIELYKRFYSDWSVYHLELL